MSPENRPFAYDGEYSPELQFSVKVLGPRKRQFLEETELFGVTIPKGYIVDGATVPRPLWPILSPFTEGFPASVPHDIGHKDRMTLRERDKLDRQFYFNLRKCGLSRTRCFLAWLGVYMWARIIFWRWTW